MKLITFTHRGSTRIGVLVGDEVVDLQAAAPALPTEMVALLAAGEPALETARAALAATDPRLSLADVHLESPILRPPKILAVGLNYADHVAESGLDTPKHPMIFNKQSTSAHPPYDPFHLPRASAALDYEGELAVVIGKRCRHVPRERAHEVVAGYTICNDVSVRDWQLRVPTFTMGKSFDTHCPLGPALVTADEIPDPHSLELHTWVNGEPRQSSNTKHLIFDCFTLIEHLSTAFTLEPGDVISTGTPGGVGIAQKPPALLKAGDVVKIAIDGLGEIENSVIDEPASTVQIG
ncbi:MAG: fumarylacetoacetate hydrolase family protein [Deltaproteobacteria bacterium]|nr:fumarylacetoacetate hydrolase family protein [Deltaproteobacteria bacterium]MBW2385324.1 fumarylacetoacetate hydrolase family protein [Deltaproteobacteria bacterium]